MAKLLQTNLDANGVARIINLPAPVASGDAANKGYVDGLVEGLAWKDNVRAWSTVNVNLAAPGATIDGVSLAIGDRFGAPVQTAPSEGGVYVFNGAAVAATRAQDMNASTEFTNAIVGVDEGTVNAGTTWRQTAINVVIGTTAIVFVAFAVGAAAATTTTPGIAAIATQAEVDAGAVANKTVTPQTLAAYANKKLKYAATVGDGAATAISVTHNLGTLDVSAQVFVVATGAEIICDVLRTNTNTVQLAFATAPAANAYRVVILG